MKTIIVILLFTIHIFAQTTTTLSSKVLSPKERAELAYKMKEEAFNRSKKNEKYNDSRNREAFEIQKKMKMKRESLSSAYQEDIRAVAEEEKKLMMELNKKYDELLKSGVEK